MLQTSPDTRLILASGSPRRRELLSGCGLSFEVMVSDVDEAVLKGEAPEAMVTRLASLKAKTIASRHRDALVVGADTTVTIDGEILGKPANAADAERMLLLLQGSEHQVWSAYAVNGIDRNIEHIEASCTRVWMVPLSASAIRRYIASGEPMDKAGSYAIQDIGAHLIDKIEGSYTNVVGINLAALIKTLLRFKAVVNG